MWMIRGAISWQCLFIANIIFNLGFRSISNSCLEGILDITGDIESKMGHIETGGTSIHGKWSYGTAQLMGKKKPFLGVLNL